MAKREGMYFYRDWIVAFEMLSDKERGKLVLAMMKYAMDGEAPGEFCGLTKMAANFIFPQIDRAFYFSALGKKGGEAAAENNSTRVIEGEYEPSRENREEKAEENPEKKDSRFEEFWAEYPKKTGKAEAKKAFERLSPDDALVDKIIGAVREQKKSDQWKSEKGRFIPSPALWLSRGQWEDERPEVSEEEKRKGSFDTDDFFEAALRRSYGSMADLCLNGT